MIRSPIRPIPIPSASATAAGSITWKNRYPYFRIRGMLMTIAPVMPPSSEIPPFHT